MANSLIDDMSGLISDILSQVGVELSADSVDDISQVMIEKGWIVSNYAKVVKVSKKQPEKSKEKARIDATTEKIRNAFDKCSREGIKTTVRNLEKVSGVSRATISHYKKKGRLS